MRKFFAVAKSERVKDKSYSGGGAREQPKPQPQPPQAAAASGYLCLFRQRLGLFAVALLAFCVRVWGSVAVRAACRRRACVAALAVGRRCAAVLAWLCLLSFATSLAGGGRFAFGLAGLWLCAF